MNQENTRQPGFGAVRLIVLIPVLLIGAAIAWYAYCEARKAYWDAKVRELCQKEGGQKILNRVSLSREEFELLVKNGRIDLPSRSAATKEQSFVYEATTTYLIHGSPEVRKYKTRVVRLADGVVLSEQIGFSRVGGDSFALHPSIFSCPKIADSLYEQTFQLK